LNFNIESFNTSGCYNRTDLPPTTYVWYKRVPLGIHSIQKVTKELTKNLNLDGFVSNTSLRRTAQNRLLSSGLPAAIIH